MQNGWLKALNPYAIAILKALKEEPGNCIMWKKFVDPAPALADKLHRSM